MGKYKAILAEPAKLEGTIETVFWDVCPDDSGVLDPSELPKFLTAFYEKMGITEKITDDEYVKMIEEYEKSEYILGKEFFTIGRAAIEALAKLEKD